MNGWRVAGAIAIVAVACPTRAQTISLDLPAGPLGVVTERLAAQGTTNIVIADPLLWSRPVRRLRGRMTVAEAIGRLAAQSGATVSRIGAVGWRLTRRLDPFRRQQAHALVRPDAAAPEVVVIGSKRGANRPSFASSVEPLDTSDQAIVAGSQAIVLASTVVSSTFRGPGRDKLFIRGIADSAFVGQTQAVTGLYFGDLRLSYGSADPDLQLHDMQSVEIIQGPQGSLYGSGSLAGVIRLNPRRPRIGQLEGAAGGGVALTAHGAPSVDGDIMLNVPLGQRTAVRLVGYAREDGGYIDKPAVGRDVNRVRIGGGRVDLRRTTGDWMFDAILVGQAVRARDVQYATSETPRLTSDLDTAEPFTSDFAAVHLVATGKVGLLEVTSSTGVSRQRLNERSDATRDATSPSIIASTRRDSLLAHETRLASAGKEGEGWVVGLSMTISGQTLDRKITLNDAEVLARIDNRITESAVYGDGAFRPWHPLLIGLGVRAVLIRSVARPEGSNPLLPADRQPIARTQGWLVPALSALFGPFAGASAFARYQQGYRPGVLVPLQEQIVDRLPRDELRSLEGGLRFAGNVFSAELSVIRSRWNDIQADYVDSAGAVFTGNIGNGRIVSLNARATWQASTALRFDTAFTYNRSTLSGEPQAHEAVGPQTSDTKAEGVLPSIVFLPRLDRIPYVAPLIARVGANYQRGLANGVTLYLNGWFRHEGQSAGAFGPIRTATQGPVWLSGFSAGLGRGSTEVRLTIDNLLDVRSARFISGTSIASSDMLVAPPRPFTARIGFRRTF